MPRTKNIGIVFTKLVPKSSRHSRATGNPVALDLPNFQKAIASIALSLDGTCMHMSKEGWREAIAESKQRCRVLPIYRNNPLYD